MSRRGSGRAPERRLTLLSQARFGPSRGLARVLALLAELHLPATFYVPATPPTITLEVRQYLGQLLTFEQASA